MITTDGMYQMFRLALLDDAQMVGHVPGGWMQNRHQQNSVRPIGIITVTQIGFQQTSGHIIRKHRVVLEVKANANTSNFDLIQRRAGQLFSYQDGVDSLNPHRPTPATDHIVNMVFPDNIGQKVEAEMVAGEDIVQVVSSWIVVVHEAREISVL